MGRRWARGGSPISSLQTEPLALVVEDAPDIRSALVSVATQRGFAVLDTGSGEEGLNLARQHRPDLVLLDIGLPDKDGLEVLQEIRANSPGISVVMVSGTANEAQIKQAMAHGAVNFVRKPFRGDELAFVLDRIYRAIEEEADIRQVLELVHERFTRMTVPSDSSLLAKVVAFLGRELCNHYPGFEMPLTEVKLALYEALANAHEHGNLEISFEEKTQAMFSEGGIHALLAARLEDPALASRRIHVTATYEDDRVIYAIRDEGKGFDPQAVVDKPMADTSALHGRGITLIRHYMEEVSWNPTGTEIRMSAHLKRRGGTPECESA